MHVDRRPPLPPPQPTPRAGPHPHARKKPNITLEQLEALKAAADGDGELRCHPRIKRSLVNRGLAVYGRRQSQGGMRADINPAGHILIQTQYQAFKTVLQERSRP